MHYSHLMVFLGSLLSFHICAAKSSVFCNTNRQHHERMILEKVPHILCYEVKYVKKADGCSVESRKVGFSFTQVSECEPTAESLTCYCTKENCGKEDLGGVEIPVPRSIRAPADYEWMTHCFKTTGESLESSVLDGPIAGRRKRRGITGSTVESDSAGVTTSSLSRFSKSTVVPSTRTFHENSNASNKTEPATSFIAGTNSSSVITTIISTATTPTPTPTSVTTTAITTNTSATIISTSSTSPSTTSTATTATKTTTPTTTTVTTTTARRTTQAMTTTLSAATTAAPVATTLAPETSAAPITSKQGTTRAPPAKAPKSETTKAAPSTTSKSKTTTAAPAKTSKSGTAKAVPSITSKSGSTSAAARTTTEIEGRKGKTTVTAIATSTTSITAAPTTTIRSSSSGAFSSTAALKATSRISTQMTKAHTEKTRPSTREGRPIITPRGSPSAVKTSGKSSKTSTTASAPHAAALGSGDESAAIKDAIKKLKSHEKSVKYLIALTYMKTFCLAGSMALVLICQFFLLRYIILKSRESEADVESAAAGNTPRKADVRKKNNMPFFGFKNKTGTEENKKVENEKPKEQRGSNELLDVMPSPVAKATPEHAPPNKPAAAVIPIPINEPVAAQPVFNAPPAPAPAPSPIRSSQGKPELQPKSMLKKNFDPAKSSYGWDWM